MDAKTIAIIRVKKRKNFFLSLILWPIVTAFLFIINYLSFNGEWWVLFPLTVWGLGLFFQGLELFGWGKAVEQWENRKIRQSLRYYPPHESLNLNAYQTKQTAKEPNLDQEELV